MPKDYDSAQIDAAVEAQDELKSRHAPSLLRIHNRRNKRAPAFGRQTHRLSRALSGHRNKVSNRALANLKRERFPHAADLSHGGSDDTTTGLVHDSGGGAGEGSHTAGRLTGDCGWAPAILEDERHGADPPDMAGRMGAAPAGDTMRRAVAIRRGPRVLEEWEWTLLVRLAPTLFRWARRYGRKAERRLRI